MASDVMNRLRWVLGASVLLAALCGCASGPTVRVDRAPDAEIANARSFGWVDDLGTDRAGYEELITTRLKRAVRATLEARGIEYAEADPNLLVNFYVNLESRQQVVRTPATGTSVAVGLGPYHGYRLGLYDPWPAYELDVREYQQGTLTVDVVDADTMRLAWEGTAEGRVTRSMLDSPDAAVENAVRVLFEQFP
jgi:hypothetical protein